MVNDELKDNPDYLLGVEDTIKAVCKELEKCIVGLCEGCGEGATCARCYQYGDNEEEFTQRIKKRLFK